MKLLWQIPCGIADILNVVFDPCPYLSKVFGLDMGRAGLAAGLCTDSLDFLYTNCALLAAGKEGKEESLVQSTYFAISVNFKFISLL